MSGTGLRVCGAVLGAIIALLLCGPGAGVARAAAAAPDGEVLSIGDPDALGRIDLYVDPLCPFSGAMIRAQGDDIGRRLDDGSLHVNLRLVSFLDRYSASGTYDSRAIYAAYAVAEYSRASDVTWNFIERIYAADRQPKEGGPTDLSNDDLADAAAEVGAPQPAVDLIRVGVPLLHDPHAIAAANLALLRGFPKPAVPLVVLDGQPVDGESDWLARLPG
jgi:hypothetical protein